MTRQLEIRGRTFLPTGTIERCTVAVDGDSIISVEPMPASATGQPHDHLIVPGFIDLHVHGGAGYDFSDSTPDEIGTILDCHGEGGTAALAATVVSSSPEQTLTAIKAIVMSEAGERGAEIVAIHLEGPFLDGARCGAQNPQVIRKPDGLEIETWLTAADGMPLIITIAPDQRGAIELIQRYPEVRFSIGHTSADYTTAVRAFEAGARRVTHLFNTMTGLHHRKPGLVGATLLTPSVVAEIIADGHHIHPAVLQIASRMMPERLILVTDAIAAAGSSDATVRLGGLEVSINEGAARLKDGTLAGSVIRMRDALVAMVERAGVPIDVTIPMMTHIPARSIGLGRRKGVIAAGADADLLVLDSHMNIVRRFVRGRE
ncbi:MAG: N-acetylglucosamine-6-phosphate deacetylase, partial [Acidobacteria bacterium]|nr:N-acetylglucosamine-6-phosphate deacetylase [Acidobacteriota bacterium]